MICEAGDVAVAPFPFSNIPVSKVRPAVVISPAAANEREGETLLAMITTAAGGPRPGDTPLLDLEDAGLKSRCVVRLKLFTLDNRLISRRVGRLSGQDRTRIAELIRGFIAI
ncbi:type II toxin-antitoxin system PemK/MazF family toxin [Brevundimonas bacteroides]|uniref:type II toxin-antitoxin system PemK/MazF family toxin n=1 Tax=Brevundimonas bacteroides TaxID=74311 RepID=UPI0009FFB05D|nr:type II toxin-antitoxin system PemK/MazF family toxin [Brevundimonas bacteroides]